MKNKDFSASFSFKRSLFSKSIILIASIFLAALFIIMITWQINMKKSIYNSSLSHLMYISNNSNEKFNTNLNYIANEIESIATSEVTIDYFSDNTQNNNAMIFSDIIRNCYNTYSALTYGISAVGMDGSIVSIGLSHLPDDYTSADWYRRALNYAGKAQVFLRDYYGKPNSKYITISCSVTEYSKVIGIILIDIKPDIFIKSFGESSIDGATRSLVTDMNGNIIFCNDISLPAAELDAFVSYDSAGNFYEHIG